MDQVFTLLMDGLGLREIRRFAASPECTWKASHRQIDVYVAKAKEKFIEIAKPDLEAEYGRALLRYDDLYTRCKKIQDYARCLAVAQERAKLLGLHAPTKVAAELTGGGGGPIQQEVNVKADPVRATSIVALLERLGIVPPSALVPVPVADPA